MSTFRLSVVTAALVLGMGAIGGVPGLTAAGVAHAQTAPATTLSSAQLQSLVSSIALYPDSLLSQVLMASTYPLEVAEANSWLQVNKGKSSSQVEDAIKNETWDNSVKSLVMFPDVLSMMAGKLSWVQQLGDAYLSQPKDLMAAVQTLRARAKAAGNLSSNQHVTVSSEQSSIIIQPANPQVVYVPQYNPTVVYGAWPYPAYPPYPVYNPGWGLMSFGAGMAVGAALWATPHWGSGSISINTTNFNQFNNRFNSVTNQQANRIGNDSTWKFNPAHRGNVPYQNPALAQRFGNPDNHDAITRSQFNRQQSRMNEWANTARPEDIDRMQQARQRAQDDFRAGGFGGYGDNRGPAGDRFGNDRPQADRFGGDRFGGGREGGFGGGREGGFGGGHFGGRR